MTSLFWRPLPISTLTVRQFFGSRAVWIVAVFAFTPILFASIYSFLAVHDNELRFFFVQELFRGLVVATLLPIVTLIPATAAFGNEIEDKTLYYLTLKPVGRWRIVLEKYLGVLVLAMPLQLLGLVISYLLVFREEPLESANLEALWPVLASASAGICAYSAVFLYASLWLRRALLAGVFYVLVWESLLGRFLPGLRIVSIRHYTESILIDLLNDPDFVLKGGNTAIVASVVLLIVVVVALMLSTRRLKRMNVI